MLPVVGGDTIWANTVAYERLPRELRDLADSLTIEHTNTHDDGDAHRRAERVTVAGLIPVGGDGRPSVALQGDAAQYHADATPD